MMETVTNRASVVFIYMEGGIGEAMKRGDARNREGAKDTIVTAG